MPAQLLVHAITAAAHAATAAPDPLWIAGGAFAVGLVVGLMCVGLILALIRRLLAVARRVVVLAIGAAIVLGIAGAFAAAGYLLVTPP